MWYRLSSSYHSLQAIILLCVRPKRSTLCRGNNNNNQRNDSKVKAITVKNLMVGEGVGWIGNFRFIKIVFKHPAVPIFSLV